MVVARIEEGLWYWGVPSRPGGPNELPVPAGTAGSVYVETDSAIVVVNPVLPAGELQQRFWRALDRDVERSGHTPLVIVTNPECVRDEQAIVRRYGSGTLRAWESGESDSAATGKPGREQCGPVDLLRCGSPREVALWLEAHEALVVGRSLVGADGRSLAWGRSGTDQAEEHARRDAFRAMLELGPRHVLTCIGSPIVDRGADALAALVT